MMGCENATRVSAQAKSARHLRALGAAVGLKNKGRQARTLDEDWLIIDRGDVVVHLLTPERRLELALEQFWSGQPRNVGLPKDD